MRKFILFLLIGLSFSSFSQEINPEFFNKIIFSTEFNASKDTKLWPLASDEDDLLLIGNGKYIIERKNTQKDKFIFPNWSNLYPNYELNVSFTMENLISPLQNIGICFHFNKENEQGFVIEFSKSKQFRIRQIQENGLIKYISGENANNSWKKSGFLLTKGEVNDINILSSGNRIEIYINNYFSFAFETELKYQTRNFGLFTTRATKATFTRVQLLINHKDQGKYDHVTDITEDHKKTDNQIVENTNPDTEKPKETDNTNKTENTAELQTALALIVKLKNELTETQKQLENQKQITDKCKQDNVVLNEFIAKNLDNKSQTRISELEKENDALKDQIARLKTENATLKDFKAFYLNQNKEKDIVNFLYEELKKLEEKNASLSRQVEQLQNQLKSPKK